MLALGNVHAAVCMLKFRPILHWKPSPKRAFLSDCSVINRKEKIYYQSCNIPVLQKLTEMVKIPREATETFIFFL